MAEKIKKGLLILAFALLALPYMQHRFEFFKSHELHGYYTDFSDVDFTVKGWFDGGYQVGINNYYNDHIGFRPELLMLNSQVDYSLFQKPDYGGTTIGSHHYLFYDTYIDAYYGRDYAGYTVIYQRFRKLRAVQDTLARLGKSLVLVYAPCKAWYCAEYLPPASRNPPGTENNYKICARIGDSLGINQVDFNSWFLLLKKTSKELLYSRQGIHWTNYGAILAGDSLTRYLERLRHIRMPHPVWTEVIHTTVPRQPDNDMSVILNLLFPITGDTFCYPEIHYTNGPGTTKPRCIYIGDSYGINLLRTELVQNITSGWQLWFYFKSIFNDTTYKTQGPYPVVTPSYWKKELNKADCIILLYTPMNTPVIGGGFIEEAYDHFFPGR